jgi:hypothetical protein
MQATLLDWMLQDVSIPLWAFVTALLLPASFIAKLAKNKINEKLGNGTNE